MPLQRRLPKRGFTPLDKKEYSIVKLGQINALDAADTITIEDLIKAGYVANDRCEVKVLACGEITKPVTVCAHKFSSSAKEKILAAGGKIQELSI